MNITSGRITRGEGVVETVNKCTPAKTGEWTIFVARASDALQIVGWCFLSRKQATIPSSSFSLSVIEHATQRQFRLQGRRFDRPDVSQSFKNSALKGCGFVCETTPNALRPGLYVVEALQRDDTTEVRTVLGNGLLGLV